MKITKWKNRFCYVVAAVVLGYLGRPWLFPVLGFWGQSLFSSQHSASLFSIITSLAHFFFLVNLKYYRISSHWWLEWSSRCYSTTPACRLFFSLCFPFSKPEKIKTRMTNPKQAPPVYWSTRDGCELTLLIFSVLSLSATLQNCSQNDQVHKTLEVLKCFIICAVSG